MNVRKLMIASAVAILAASTGAGSALAHGTSLFASEANARSVCGDGNVVWAVFNNGHYYKKGTPGYEWGKGESKGAYTCEKAAQSKGWHLAKNIQ